jgi:hypothetical protein
MLHMNAVSSYVMSLGLLTVFLLIWVVQRQKNPQAASMGFASGATGVLLGAIGAYGILSASGYDVVKPSAPPPAPAANAGGGPPAGGGMGGMMGGGMPGGGMGGMMGGGMPGGGMGGMMGGGGGRGPAPKRDLTTLVRKLDLLTGNIGIKLDAEQTAAILKGLAAIEDVEKMTDDEAKARHEELTALLNDDQKSQLDTVGLPFGGRGGAGGGGPGAGGPGGGGGGGMGGGAPPDPDANPFLQENALNALKSFRGRFDGQPAAESAENGKAAP